MLQPRLSDRLISSLAAKLKLANDNVSLHRVLLTAGWRLGHEAKTLQALHLERLLFQT